jgi:EAL and modified HD-GYP domain-containing signal transduction protein
MSQDQVFIGRQPILDRHQRIAAYELLFRQSAEAKTAVFDDQLTAASRVIVNTFATIGVGPVLGRMDGFVNVTQELFHGESVEALPSDRVVIELLENIAPDDRVVARCRELRQRGYKLALDDYVFDDPRAPLVELVDYVKVDVLAVPDVRLPRLVARLQRHGLRLLAEKVEDTDMFERCRDLGFDLFQGFYFARPTIVTGKPVDPARSVVLRLLQQLSADAEVDELSESFKQNADLGLNLLRLVNSAAMARKHKIATVNEAVAYLGRRQLRRWLTLLLFAGTDGLGGGALLATAAVRGRLMELLVQARGEADRELQDRAFLVGMLSLVDALLGVPKEVLLADLNLEESIQDAIVEGKGVLGSLLEVVAKVEVLEVGGLAELLAREGISVETLRQAQLEAYAWMESLDEEREAA